MSFRPTVTLTFVLIALAVVACRDAHAQDAPAARGDSTPSLKDAIELAEIRLAIRLQQVEVAKAERRLIARGAEGVSKQLIEVAELKFRAAEKDASRLSALKNRGLVSEGQLQEAGRRSLEAMLERDKLKAVLAASSDKLAVHDARIKVLELRARLAKAKLMQLKRRLKRGD